MTGMNFAKGYTTMQCARWLTIMTVAGWASLAHAQSAAVQKLLDEADEAFSSGDYGDAGKRYDRAIAAAPDTIEPAYYAKRADTFLFQKKYTAGLQWVENVAIRNKPNEPVILEKKVLLLAGTGQEKQAVDLATQLVTKLPKAYALQLFIGDYQFGRDNAGAEPAIAAYQAFLDSRPNSLAAGDASIQVKLAYAHLRRASTGAPEFRTNLSAADRLLTTVSSGKAKSLSRVALNGRCAALSGLADHQRAVKVCSDAISASGNKVDPALRYNVGVALLGTGRADAARKAADAYIAARPRAVRGYLLQGDIAATQRDLEAASNAYERAAGIDAKDPLVVQRLTPLREFKVARNDRRSGKYQAAADRLRASRPPVHLEDEYAIEYGEALYGAGQFEPLRTHMTPWVKSHGNRAVGQFLLGEALRGLNDMKNAVAYLERANAGGEPRAKKPLVQALGNMGLSAASKGDLAEAKSLLLRAEAVSDDVETWRNVGAVMVAAGDRPGVNSFLDKLKGKDLRDPVTQHVLARAYQAADKSNEARAAYTEAIRGYGNDPRAMTARLDLTRAELDAKNVEQAAAAVKGALQPNLTGATKSQAIAAARAVATEALRASKFGLAAELLRPLESMVGANDVEVDCDLALALTGSGQHDAAMVTLKRLVRVKARCPFTAPADELGVPILIAWNEGSSPRSARRALTRLDGMRKQVSGVAEPLVRTAEKEIALRAAADAYNRGDLNSASTYLTSIRSTERRSPEVVHNLAVLALAHGRVDSAISDFESVIADVPEALLNLGVAYDRRREPLKALDQWRKASARGVRYPQLTDWIEAKEIVWEGGAK